MKGKIFTLAMLMAFCLVRTGYSQEVPAVYEDDWWYTMHRGTMSHRLTSASDTPVDPENLYLGTYLGAPYGSETERWNSGAYESYGRTNGYEDFAIFWSKNKNDIDERSDVEVLPNGQFFKWRMNLRMATPHAYKADPDNPNKKYPMIIMMHGAGETAYCAGNGCISSSNRRKYSNDNNLYHGGKQHLDAMNRPEDDPQHWPGFVVFPHGNGQWIETTDPNDANQILGNRVRFVKMMVELILQGYPIDPYRIYIHGLSNGGRGTYLLLYDHPDLIAAAAPMSGSSPGGYLSKYGYDEVQTIYPPDESLVHVPIWQFQGATDTRPTPRTTNFYLDVIRNAGGNVRYKEYPLKGHSIWYDAYAEPDFFSWFLQYSKLSIHSYYNVNRICPGVTLRLGISPGFLAYEWEQSTNQGQTWQSYNAKKDPLKPNEILADEPGLYRVRVQRDAGNGQVEELEWSPWSEPFELFHRDRPKPEISTNGSWVLWGLNNNTSLTLSSDYQSAQEYTWYKNTAVYPAGNDQANITLNAFGEGNYTMEYVDDLCPSLLSEPVYINRAPTDGGEPGIPQNFQGKSTGISTTTLWWEDGATEIGYEIYRSIDGGATYIWVANTFENTVQYDDSQLPGGQSIFYKIRAFNEHGASEAVTLEISMPEDVEAPTTPENFSFTRFAIEEFRSNPKIFNPDDDLADQVTKYDEHFVIHLDTAIFSWSPVEDDTPMSYDVYDGRDNLIGSTQDTSFAVPGLAQNQTYDFYVRARDINNLVSGKSQKGTTFTAFNGLYYYYYQGALWDSLADYSFHPYSHQGRIHNFVIKGIPEFLETTDYFAYDFIGFINILEAGSYEFRTRSDDGSSLWIGDTKVVDNDGRHSEQNRDGTYVFSSPGIYPITVKYFERLGGENLSVSWRKPGQTGFTPIPNNVLTSTTLDPPALPNTPTNLVATANQLSADLSWDHNREDVKIVVLGSSTAAGVGASSTATSWVGLMSAALEQQNEDNEVVNLAFGGYTTYEILPSGTSTPGNRPDVDETRNITAAINANADIVIVNLPSNDRANNYDLTSETLENLLAVQAEATAANVEIYFTTTQPRTALFDQTKRDLLAEEAAYIMQFFGPYAINIYDELADSDGTIKGIYDSGDGVHLKDTGHDYLFQTIWTQVNAQSIPIYEVFRSQDGGDYVMAVSTGKQTTSGNDPNLLPGTQYDYKVRAVTSAGASPFSNVSSIETIGDTEDPTIPLNLEATGVTDTKITLIWDASTDNVGVVKYVIVDVTGVPEGRMEEEIMGETHLTSITLDGLTPSENYEMVVYAEDYAGNKSGYSNRVSVTTQQPLPVEFLEVSHRITEEGVLIQWATASELNNAFFTVERGTGIDDFAPIGGVDGSGTTDSRRDYALLDPNPLDLAYYRVKQTDFDGAFEYSKIIRVVYDEGNLPEFTVYPNPTTQENIQARGYVPSDKAMVLVKLLDVMGKTHMVKELDPNQFINGVKIDLNYPVPPGVYIIHISDGVNNTQRRVVIR